MEAVSAVLVAGGWTRGDNYLPPSTDDTSPPRRVFTNGERRAYVGPHWTTFYTKSEGVVDDMRSVKNDNMHDIKVVAGIYGRTSRSVN